MTEATKFEGKTTFPSSSSSIYRYKLNAKANRLTVWLEQCRSANQWCVRVVDAQMSLFGDINHVTHIFVILYFRTSGELELNNFISSKAAIPGVSADRYVSVINI